MQRLETKREPKPGWTGADGVLTGTVTGERMIVLPAEFLSSMKQFLLKAYGDSVGVVMNRMAAENGYSFASRWKDAGLSPEEAFRLLAQMEEVAGWGGLSVEGDFAKGKVRVTVFDCAFCPKGALGKDHKCDFMAGIAEGVCKAIYGKEFNCDLGESTDPPERKCVLHMSEATEQKNDNWKTAVHFPWMLESQ